MLVAVSNADGELEDIVFLPKRAMSRSKYEAEYPRMLEVWHISIAMTLL